MSRSAEPPPASAEGSEEEGLLTSEDLFGDLVDEPLAPAAARAAARRSPVKVRVAEKAGPQAKVPATAEVPVEEMAGLVDAFGPAPEPAPAAAPASPPAPEAAAPPRPAPSPIASGRDVDALLDNLSALEEPAVREVLEPPPSEEPLPASEPLPGPPPPPPEEVLGTAEPPSAEESVPESDSEEDLGQLLDGLEEDETPQARAEEPVAPAAAEPAAEPIAAVVAEPLVEKVEPPEPPTAGPPLPATAPAEEGEEFGHLLDVFEPSAAPPAPEISEPASLADSGPEPVAAVAEPLVEKVEPPEPPTASPPPPAAAQAEEGEEFGQLLDVFEPTTEPPTPEIGEPASLSDSAPSVMEQAPPVEEAPAVDEALLPEPPEPPALAEEAQPQEEDLDEVLARFIPTLPPPQEAPPPVIALKFQALEPSVEAPKETRTVIDLAALADEALSLPLTRPGVPLASEPHPQPSAESSPPDAYGPYRLLERIAAGGMAEVFRAKRSGVEGFEKVVAVKRILPHLSDNKEFVEMFIDEAKMVAGLSHPNIVQIFDLGKIERTYFIAMEYVHGKDLRTILKRAKEKGLRIPLDLSVLIISKVCSALEYAHRKKDENGQPLRIVHRDISPQNILISFEGEVKLTDFGIAKATSKATDTDRGALRGKLLYMSPEQASGHPLDKRSDVFSLGVVFYEMITDVKPFLGTSEKGILQLVRECRFEPARSLNPRISEKLEGVVTRALVKDPEERYQDASEMYRDLERVLHERQPPAATELARFMEILFESGDVPEGSQAEVPEARADGGIEIDLDSAEPGIAPSSDKGEPPKDPQGIGKLLKRFGIKQR